jgi:hypothetical protein
MPDQEDLNQCRTGLTDAGVNTKTKIRTLPQDQVYRSWDEPREDFLLLELEITHISL